MMITLFRSRLTVAAGDAEYHETEARLLAQARAAPGFVDVKSFRAEDGEHLTVVWWQDAETLERWRNDSGHLAAKDRGRERWYQSFRTEVAELVWSNDFVRAGP